MAAPKCSMKPLLKTVTVALKLKHKIIKNYIFKIQFKTSWLVQDNQAGTDALQSEV